MKNLTCSIHRKWSLLMALFPRLWFYENTLWRSFPDLWQYRLELPCKDFVTFFPYIVSVGGMRLNFKNSRISWGWRKKTVKDPINIVAYGVSPKEFLKLLQKSSLREVSRRETNPKWKQFMGSSYFLHGSSAYIWHASIAIKIDIDERARERHHIRLFGLKSAHGKKVTLIAAHRDRPYHKEEEAPLSWNETRDLVASDLRLICGLSEQVTDLNWRDAEGDGKILIINCK